jgi:hypothetical protein
MAKTSLSRKLRIQPGQRALVLNSPEGYLSALLDLPDDVELSTEPEGEYDFVHLFVKDSAQLDDLRATAIAAVRHDGLLWISYPKKSSKVETNLTRDVLWELMSDTGLRPVTQVSIDAVWSAMRFRPLERVGT